MSEGRDGHRANRTVTRQSIRHQEQFHWRGLKGSLVAELDKSFGFPERGGRKSTRLPLRLKATPFQGSSLGTKPVRTRAL